MSTYEIASDVPSRVLALKIADKPVAGFDRAMITLFCIFAVNPNKDLTHDFLISQMRRLGYTTASRQTISGLVSKMRLLLRVHKADSWIVTLYAEGYKFRPPAPVERPHGQTGKHGWRKAPLSQVA